MKAISGSPWLIFDKSPAKNDVILFCLPYAGGGASIFRLWQKQAPLGITLCRIQLPGRESRIKEVPLTDMNKLLDELFTVMQPWCENPFVLFGHSMGGIIAAELSLRFQKANKVNPIHLFISGSRPPHSCPNRSMHKMASVDLRQALSCNGGTPDEILACDELMALFEPVIRADYTILETWAPRPIRKINIPITVFAGLQDTVVPYTVVSEWKYYASHSFRQINFDAEHFFIRTHSNLLTQSLFSLITSGV